MLLLWIGLRFGSYCLGQGSDFGDIALDMVPTWMLLLGLGFRLGSIAWGMRPIGGLLFWIGEWSGGCCLG